MRKSIEADRPMVRRNPEFQEFELTKVSRPNFIKSNIPDRSERNQLPSSSQLIYLDNSAQRHRLKFETVGLIQQPM